MPGARSRAGELDNVAERFHREFAKVLDGVWMQTTSEDLRFAQAEGKRPWWLRFANAYTARVYRRSHADTAVSCAFLEVMHLIQSPASLLRPSIAWRVLKPVGLSRHAASAPKEDPCPSG